MSVVIPLYYKYTTDGKNYIIKEVVENGEQKYSKAEVESFENKTFKENNEIIKFAKDTEENDMSLHENFNFDGVTDEFVVVVEEPLVEPPSTGGRRRRSKSSKKRVKKSRKGGKAKKSKKVRKH